MDYHQPSTFAERDSTSLSPTDAFPTDLRLRLPTAIAILTCLAITFLTGWPTSIERKLWEGLVYLIPSSFLYAMEFPSRRKNRKRAGHIGFRRMDFGNQQAKSEALQRLLGLHQSSGSNPMQPVRRLSDLNRSLQPEISVPAGLGNWDNSCYQNSIIQALASLSAVDKYLSTNVEKMRTQDLGTTHAALRGIICRLKDMGNEGKRLWTPPVLKSMNSWQQQDAQEYFSRVIDETENEVSKVIHGQTAGLSLGKVAGDGYASTALKANPFQGLLAQRVGCTTCRYTEGLSLLPFTCLTVNLGMQSQYDIQNCLDEYTALESIEGVECIKCTILRAKASLEQVSANIDVHETDSTSMSALKKTVMERLRALHEVYESGDYSDSGLYKKCTISAKSRISSTKSKQAVIARAPNDLVIHINRSIFDATGFQRKNHARVGFPLDLNLNRWCLGANRVEDDAEIMESWNTDPIHSMLPISQAEDSAPSKMYKLQAVITHYGGHENGHYITYRRRPPAYQGSDRTTSDAKVLEDSWYCFNDDIVSPVSQQHVLSQGGVFMLFYEATSYPADVPDAASIPLVDQRLVTSTELPLSTAIPQAYADPMRNLPPPDTNPRFHTAQSASETVPRADIVDYVKSPGLDDPQSSSKRTSVAPAMRTASGLSPGSQRTRRLSNISMHSPSFITAS